MATSSSFHFVLSKAIKNDINIKGKENFNSKEKHFFNAFNNFKTLFNEKLFCDAELIAAIDGTK